MTQEAGYTGERLRQAGLRVTPQRRAVLDAFRGGESGHLTAEEVFRAARREIPELARATVYNALAELVRVGLLQTVEGLGAVRYDPNLDPDHHHFHCLRCGRLYDVSPQGVEGVKLVGSFEVRRKLVLFEGVCEQCASGG
jgi:Fe2+ or Zn2+ uptake regulation protein